MQRVLSVLAILWLSAAAIWSVLLARADASFREGRPAGGARAAEQMPHNVVYLTEAALSDEYEGRDTRAQLERIAALSPLSSAPRIRLGLLAERDGDSASAERWLREAYTVDRQFETRWTLANFYLRQGRDAEFWTWIRSALEMSYGDRRPAFDLCWRISSDADEILKLAIPEREDVAAAYVLYLLDRGKLGAVVSAARRTRDPEVLLSAVDSLLEERLYPEAVEVWKLLGRGAPDGENVGDFQPPQSGRGFDWRDVLSAGVTHVALDAGRGHRIRLSGLQAESVDLRRRYVGGLRPGERYRIEADLMGAPAGLEWVVNGKPVQEFRAPAEVALITLRYRRPRGEVRAEATIDVQSVKLLPLH